jgi:hypothetical protein
LRDRRRGNGGGGSTGCGNFQKITTLHSGISLWGVSQISWSISFGGANSASSGRSGGGALTRKFGRENATKA